MPVALFRAGDKKRSVIAYRLRNVDLHLAFPGVVEIVKIGPVGLILLAVMVFILKTVVTGIAVHMLIGGFIKGIKALRRIAIAQQLEVGAERVQRLGVQKTYGLPFVLAAVHQRTVGLCDIRRDRAKIAHIEPDTQGKRPVVRRYLAAAIGGEALWQPPDDCPLGKVDLILLIVAAAVFPGGQRIFHAPFTLEQRHRRIRHRVAIFATVCLLNRHL